MAHTGLLILFICQPTKSSNFSRSGINVRAHLLRKNYSRNLSSIRSAPQKWVLNGYFHSNKNEVIYFTRYQSSNIDIILRQK